MARRQVLVQLTDGLVDRLDKLAAMKGSSRSAVIRHVLERYVPRESEEEMDRRLIEGYTRFPPDEDDDLDEWREIAPRELLDEESW